MSLGPFPPPPLSKLLLILKALDLMPLLLGTGILMPPWKSRVGPPPVGSCPSLVNLPPPQHLLAEWADSLPPGKGELWKLGLLSSLCTPSSQHGAWWSWQAGSVCAIKTGWL